MSHSVWLSFDVEATGPVPGLHSMISLGISAWRSCNHSDLDDMGHCKACGHAGDLGPPFRFRFQSVGSFSVNIRELDYCTWDPDTHKWWHDHMQAAALVVTTEHPSEPREAMEKLMDFLEGLPKDEHIWAAYPATFDMPFVRYYAQRFVRERWVGYYGNPMERIACFDIGSYAMRQLDCDYHDVSKERMPPHWTEHENPLPHVALNDAEEQAHMLMAMLQDG